MAGWVGQGRPCAGFYSVLLSLLSPARLGVYKIASFLSLGVPEFFVLNVSQKRYSNWIFFIPVRFEVLTETILLQFFLGCDAVRFGIMKLETGTSILEAERWYHLFGGNCCLHLPGS